MAKDVWSYKNVFLKSFEIQFLGRMALLITLFLVLVTIYGSAMGTLPSAETPTFLEIWMLSCIVFILGVFLQTTLIIIKLRYKEK